MRDRGKFDEALATGAAAIAEAPASLAVHMAVRSALGRGVPPFHGPMLRDEARNLAYARAIERAVKPGMQVLEIGCGAGLLAMIAARAGAWVTTCESNPMIAAAAREVVRRNGLSDRINIIAKPSQLLRIPEDLPGPADLVIHEIFGRHLFDEGVDQAMTDARTRLLKSGAPSVPASAAIRFSLVRDSRERETQRLDDVLGFDLSAFEPLQPWIKSLRPSRDTIEFCSDAVSALAMDFQRSPPFGPSSETVSLPSRGGRVDAVAQWLSIDFGSGTTYENSPMIGSERSHWDVALLNLPASLATLPGEPVDVTLRHRAGLLTIDVNKTGGT